MKGIIYLLQPAELVGTDRYKIGMSKKTSLDRIKTYKIGTRYLSIHEVENPLDLENKIKTDFKKRFNLIAGTEYFQGNEKEIKYQFNFILSRNNFKCPHCINGYDYKLNVYCSCWDGLASVVSFFEGKDDYCDTCDNMGIDFNGNNCKCGRKPNYKCIRCEDTGHHKGEIGNYCCADVGNGKLCPYGKILIDESERLSKLKLKDLLEQLN